MKAVEFTIRTDFFKGFHFQLQIKYYTIPIKYRTILLIADSEKNDRYP